MNSTIYLIGDMINTFLQMMSVSERAELSVQDILASYVLVDKM